MIYELSFSFGFRALMCVCLIYIINTGLMKAIIQNKEFILNIFKIEIKK